MSRSVINSMFWINWILLFSCSSTWVKYLSFYHYNRKGKPQKCIYFQCTTLHWCTKNLYINSRFFVNFDCFLIKIFHFLDKISNLCFYPLNKLDMTYLWMSWIIYLASTQNRMKNCWPSTFILSVHLFWHIWYLTHLNWK